MIILDDSYVSHRMIDYLQQSKQPVLESEMSKSLVAEGANLVIVAENEAVERINAGESLYAMSESHFGWVMENISQPDIIHGLSVFKDKERMRSVLAPMYPNYLFQAVSTKELMSMEFPASNAPYVLKPSVGFLSLGIYIVRNEAEWNTAIRDIQEKSESWSQWYDSSVIGTGRFILESLITGTEYALDAYYDENGQPHLLNILRHDFANEEDTSDRLYLCGASIMKEKRDIMLDFLTRANELAMVRNFPVHVEVREQDGVIYPIEFNALRFAGLGGTEVSKMAFDFFTFDHYLHGTEPDWDKAFAAAGDSLYCMSVLNPPAGTPRGTTLDYEAFLHEWESPIDMDRFNYDETGIMGFLFWKTSAQDDSERIRMLNDNLLRFLQIG